MQMLFYVLLGLVAFYIFCLGVALVASLLLIRHKLREHQEKFRFGWL